MNYPVCSYNEWDPLEEIIVGTIDGVTAPVLTHDMKTFIRIDEERVVVEKSEEATIKFFKEIGLKPILVDFKDHYIFGG
ncbi:MAG: hypothetical protein AAGJ08_03990 [Cyanobacteria bacterium P01_H01_bin.35]